LICNEVLHAVPEGVLNKADGLHVPLAMRVEVASLLEDNVEVVAAGCNVHFVVPEVEGHEGEPKQVLKVLDQLASELFGMEVNLL
jgi:hypothetical protein